MGGASSKRVLIGSLIDWWSLVIYRFISVPNELRVLFPPRGKQQRSHTSPVMRILIPHTFPSLSAILLLGGRDASICNWKWKLSRGVVRFGERFTRAKHFTPSPYKVNLLLLLLPEVLRRVSGRPQVVKSASTADGASGMCGLMQWKAIPQSA